MSEAGQSRGVKGPGSIDPGPNSRSEPPLTRLARFLPLPKSCGGQSLVELSLVLPLIIVLLIATVDLGRVFYYETVLASGVREGARKGVDRNATDAQIISAVNASAQDISSLTGYSCCTITPAAPRTGASGQTVSVTASFNLTFITPGAETVLSMFLAGGVFPMSQTGRMVII